MTGWQVSAIVSAVSGAPFTPLVGFDQAGLQTGGTQRPNLAAGRSLDDAVTGGQLDAACGCITGYFDPTFFTLPAAGTLGTGVGRDSLRGPGLLTVDLGVSKNVGLSGGAYLQLRAEVFNLFNRVNYGAAQRGDLHRHGGRRRSVQPECRSDHDRGCAAAGAVRREAGVLIPCPLDRQVGRCRRELTPEEMKPLIDAAQFESGGSGRLY